VTAESTDDTTDGTRPPRGMTPPSRLELDSNMTTASRRHVWLQQTQSNPQCHFSYWSKQKKDAAVVAALQQTRDTEV